MSPEHLRVPIQEKNAHEITRASLLLLTPFREHIPTVISPEEPFVLTLRESSTMEGLLQLTYATSPEERQNSALKRSLTLCICTQDTNIATRSYFFQGSALAPEYVFVTSALEVEQPFRGIGIGTALLTNDRPFQELAGQLMRIDYPRVLYVDASYADQTAGKDRYWTTRRLAGERNLPRINNQYKEVFPIPPLRKRT